jgi:hypothetical protein
MFMIMQSEITRAQNVIRFVGIREGAESFFLLTKKYTPAL